MSFFRSRTPALLAGGLAVLVAVALAGCGSSASTNSPSASAGTPVVGGKVVIDVPSDEGCADPEQVQGRSLLIAGRAELDSLVYLNDKSKLEPWLAKSWSISPDGKSFTFKLRDDVTFSDGTKFTSAAVKSTLDSLVSLGAKALGSSYLGGYTGTATPDATTAVVSFSAPNAAFLTMLATPSMGIISPASAQLSQGQRCSSGVIGTGPYVLKSYTQNQGQVLTVRKDYKWAPEGQKQGRGYLDEVDFQIVPDSSVRASSVIAGEADIETEANAPDLTTLAASNIPIAVRSNPGAVEGLMVNTKSGVMSDPAVRQALQWGLDRKTIVAKTLTKYRPVPSSVLSDVTPGYTDESSEFGYDVAKAKKLLDSDGWTVGSDGIREKDGQKLTVSLLYAANRYASTLPMIELIQAEYKAIGVDMELRGLPDATATADWVSGDYQLWLSGLTQADGNVLTRAFKGMDPQLDTLLAEQIAATDTSKRNAILAQAQKYILDQGIDIPVDQLSLPSAISPKVHGAAFEGDSLLLLHELWKSE